MHKAKQSPSSVLREYVTEFGEDILSADGTAVKCIVCGISVAGSRTFLPELHVNTVRRRSNDEALLNLGPITEGSINFRLICILLSRQLMCHLISRN